MENTSDFSQRVIEAANARAQWYNTSLVPKLVENYRLLQTCAKNLYDLMIQKGIMIEDPYRLDQKINGVRAVDNESYADTDRTTVISVRFSFYETMLDWICTYYKFSVETLTLPEIKKIIDFNNSFVWNELYVDHSSPNTRGLAFLVSELKKNADAILASAITDIVSKCKIASNELKTLLKEIADFEKEFYKSKIRRDVFTNEKFDKTRAAASSNDEMTQIKKVFPLVFKKEPFYTQLVEEIINEDLAPNKESLQAAVLKKLSVQDETQKKKKAKTIDPREYLMASVQTLASVATPLETINAKFNENSRLLHEIENTGLAKFLGILRKAFHLAPKPVVYEISFTDEKNGTQKKQKIDFQPFCAGIQKRINFYNSFAKKGSLGYNRFYAADAAKVLDFLTTQSKEVQTLGAFIKALDAFFKNSVPQGMRSRIKGVSMELMAIKNGLVNSNQYRAEFTSFIEEQEQMKKLGIQYE